MPLVSILQELKKAQQEHYAIPLFDTLDMQSTDAMFTAFEEKHAPGIIALYTSAMDRPNAKAFAAYIRQRAMDSKVPISLMLDHGGSFEYCIKAISYGFTDVMYDGSRLSMEENIENTRAIVRVAHAVGICVEAELGHVGSGSQYQTYGGIRKGFTDPNTVEEFISRTGVDFLAIAIGTAHGLYAGEPHLDLDLLSNIRAKVDIPLVMHGGTGCTENQFQEAIKVGISKINIATDLFVSASRNLVEAAKVDKPSYFGMSKAAYESFLERCNYYIDLFGAKGKA